MDIGVVFIYYIKSLSRYSDNICQEFPLLSTHFFLISILYDITYVIEDVLTLI